MRETEGSLLLSCCCCCHSLFSHPADTSNNNSRGSLCVHSVSSVRRRIHRGTQEAEGYERIVDAAADPDPGDASEGASDAEVCRALGIAERTLRWHLANVHERLGSRSRVQMVAVALRRRLLPGPVPLPRRVPAVLRAGRWRGVAGGLSC